MYKLSYGLFVLTAKEGTKDNGCIINTAIQAASVPNQMSVCVSKSNFTHDMIMRTGDKVLISPDLTHAKDWTQGEVIEVENNPFVGIVISAKTADGNIFFGYKDLFEPAKEAVCTH